MRMYAVHHAVTHEKQESASRQNEQGPDTVDVDAFLKVESNKECRHLGLGFIKRYNPGAALKAGQLSQKLGKSGMTSLADKLRPSCEWPGPAA